MELENSIGTITNDVLNNVFQLFVGHDKMRPVMNSPFEYNGMVYATDSYCIVRISKDLYTLPLDNPHEPLKADNVFFEPNKSILLDVDSHNFEKLKTAEGFDIVGNDVTCVECSGFGQVTWTYNQYSDDFDCPCCGGDGYSEREREVPNGSRVFGDHFIKIFDTYLDVALFYKVIEVQQLTGESIILTYQNDARSAVMFKIGIYEIMIMPKMVHSSDFDDSVIVLNVA